jgi:ABC-type Na+ efflux pump permease subunit
MRTVLLVARREITDLRRDKAAWRALFLQPLLIALALAPIALAAEFARREGSNRSFTVAVTPEAEAVPGLTDALRHNGLRIRSADDAVARVAAETVDAAVSLEGDDPPRLVIDSVPVRNKSERAAGATVRALEDLRQDLVRDAFIEAGADPAAAQPLSVAVEDVSQASPRGARLTLSAALPTLIAIQLFSLVSLAQQRIGGAKDRRSLEPLLVLPLSRAGILGGAAGAATAVGLAASAVILGPLSVLLFAGVGQFTGSLAGPVSVVASLGLEAALLATVFATAGAYVGARSASGVSANTTAAVVQVVLLAILMASVFVAEADVTPALALTPVLGALVVAREGIADALVPAHVGMSVTTHLGLAAVLLFAGARRLGDQQSVLRVGR